MKSLVDAKIAWIVTAAALWAVGTTDAAARHARHHRMRPERSAVARHLFEPGLVMANQSAIGISAAQRDELMKSLQSFQSEILKLRFALSAEAEKLVGLLRTSKVDEAAAIAQSARVMALEKQVKTRHLRMLIRLKNQLSAAQQQKLRALRRGK